ncbi:glycoside hydrolase family 3 protein [Sphingomonas crusticola]|uniref:glycoside hydrolase family 3 protein n=1 Tax=Sphingomonas crusticola TaxID=1697973 RepID=UPI000E21F42F|nr:glycoside hydrolase family 3 protein [Sphingomonas crusticola]
MRFRQLLLGALCAGITLPVSAQQAHPELWPAAHSPLAPDAKMEARITAMLGRMSIEEKVGQTLQPEMKFLTPADVAKYHIGSIENGGGSVPGGNKHAGLADWLKVIDGFWRASVDPANKGERIPLMWASDAVHGHNNVFGATIFPHNIGLGAARDPRLIERIGRATAEEVRATGMDWSFAPVLAVVRDDRWGRTYESYSEDPALVASYAGAMVRGLQGSGKTFLDRDHVVASAKHFLGDGGTDGGRDQGDNRASEAALRDIHGAGYPPAIDAGVQVVMVSFSSWQGQKMHANASLITDVLKRRMGFDGIAMGDWNAHGQVPGCTNGDCPISTNAGIDVYDVPEDWKALFENSVREVKAGTIPLARLDDQVRRVLRVKLRAGLFDEGLPSTRPHAGDTSLLGSPAHRAVAREAVRKSLVLLKNDAGLLPLNPRQHILVAGAGADSIMKQTGGWSLSWQGNDNANTDFPGATSIWGGIEAAVRAAGGTATLSPDGGFTAKPDAAIVVFGENPYAEFQGDQADVALHSENAESLALLRKLKAAGVPTVAVLISGRPLYLNPQINAADAFVAAWLPGSEGAGVADVLLAKANGRPNFDFAGKLSFSWPRSPDQTPLNVGDPGYDPQFAYGYGLRYGDTAKVGLLREVAIASPAAERGVFLKDGIGVNGFALSIGDAQAPRIAAVGSRMATYGKEALTLRQIDRNRQQDAWAARWSGAEPAWIELYSPTPVDLAREANGAMVLTVALRMVQMPAHRLEISMGGAAPAASALAAPLTGPTGQWQTLRIPLRCFGGDLAKVQSIRLSTDGAAAFDLGNIAVQETRAGDRCPG